MNKIKELKIKLEEAHAHLIKVNNTLQEVYELMNKVEEHENLER